MPKTDKVKTETTAVSLGPDGLLTIPVSMLMDLEAEGVTRQGIIVLNDKRKVNIVMNGKPVQFGIGLYVSRDPLDETEVARVTQYQAERAAREAKVQAETEAKEAAQRSNVQAAFRMGKEGAAEAIKAATGAQLDMLRNLDQIAPILENLRRAT